MKNKLTIALATRNEEQNIDTCLGSVKDIADEIIIVDGSSTDKTVEIAKTYGARVLNAKNYPNFHINKKRAMDEASSEWILQLDADERVSPALAEEIKRVIQMSQEEIQKHQANLKGKKLFLRHQSLLEKRDGNIGRSGGDYVAFFTPRRNFFLGKYLKYGGTYPDGVIRLVKNGKAYLPAKDVHEQMVVEGKVGWLGNDLLHLDSPTFRRYLERNNRYISLLAADLKKNNVPKNIRFGLDYFIIKPLSWFFITQIRHKGILDGYQGVIFSFFSALRFPRAYLQYLYD